jgi:hypothetical protein
MSYFTDLWVECAKASFTAGILGNLVASGIQWLGLKQLGLKDILLKGENGALNNHDLVRALVHAELESATEIVDITLLEDYGAETSATKNWVTSLSFLMPGKALHDQSNKDIKRLWDLRTQLEDRVKELNKLTAEELNRQLVVKIAEVHLVAAPDLSQGIEGAYAEWSEGAANALYAAMQHCVAPAAVPNTLRTRILNGEWFDLFRLAFREELKRNEDAETAYFINVHDTLANHAQEHSRELGNLKDALMEGYNLQKGKISELRNLLLSLRGLVKSLEAASSAERKKIIVVLNGQEANWRKLVEEQQQHWRQAHAAHSAILKAHSRAGKQMAGIAGDVKDVKSDLKDVKADLKEARSTAARSSRFDPLTANLIRYLKREFWGRHWLFDQINEFREKNHATGGYVVITGLPGQGKSAIAAQLADEASSLLHLFRRGTLSSDLNNFHAHLLEQAAAQFQISDDNQKKGRSPTVMLEALFWELSNQMAFPTDCLIVIDALDEAAPEALKNAGINPLGLPQKLGRGIFVVITSRERNDCDLAEVDAATPVHRIELHRSKESSSDAADYIRHHLADPRVSSYLSRNNASADEFARTLLAKSESNFMYLHHVLKGLAEGILVHTKLDHLPTGLREYYALHWQTMINEAQGADLGWKMSVLAVLASLQEQCSATAICEIVHRIPAALQKLNPETTIQNKVRSSTSDDVRALLAEWQEFLLTDHPPDLEPESRIYHLEFSDFLRQEALQKPIDFVRVTARAFFEWQKANRRLTDA